MPPLDRWLFKKAIQQGVRKARRQWAPWAGVLDVLVLSNVRDRLGGSFRYLVSGGAALPAHVAEFYLALGLTVLQGYGLTETSGATCVNRPERNKYWTVGEPLDVEVRLAEDGEILVRGTPVMQGYYNLPEETAQVLDAQGWFHTGDIGEWEGASLKITDRKKDLFKLSNGKYIAPQPLENRLKEGGLIVEAVVFGDGQDMVTALILPDYDEVRARLTTEATDPELAHRDDVRALVKQEVDAVNRALPPHEVVKRFSLLERPFSIEGGELTPTLKVRRRIVAEKHADALVAMR
jgi:long-chain acyl-CoA synthetase